MKTDFVDWVEAELIKREWSRADLARKSNLSTAQITRVLNREQNPGPVFYEGISRAFGVTLEAIYRHGNVLPPVDEKTAQQRELEHLLKQVPDTIVSEVLEYLRFRSKRRK